jgi:Kef-type K+ transport system membrane component KefB
LEPITAIYVAVALTFSSTIIIVKLLSDKREVDSLHGRIAIGFLIVQDLVVVFAMMVLSALGIASEASGTGDSILRIALVLAYGAAILGLVGVFIRYVALPLTSRLARSTELLITFAIAWAALLAALGDHLGFGKELGGLLAGVSLASTPYRETILSRLASLRDFLLLFFFIALGAMLDLSLLGAQAGAAIILSLFVLIGNPLIVMLIMRYLGFHQRTGFFAGLTVAQISEFSLIFMAMGMTLGHVSADALGLVTLVGLITIAASVYMISYSHTLYRVLEPALAIFQPRVRASGRTPEQAQSGPKRYDVILFGLGRYGTAIANNLLASGYSILSIDFNPDAVRSWQREGHSALFGDASDQEFLSSLPLENVRWVVSAIPQYDFGVSREDPRVSLLEALKQSGFTGKVAVTTQKASEVEELRKRGADLVLQPFHDAALHVAQLMAPTRD